jgi:hypothetical protein
MRLWIVGIIFCICIPLGTAAAETVQPLFYIERSLNANIVRYDVRLTSNGILDQKEPVIVYWLLNAEDGRREDLSYIERTRAYGIKVEPNGIQGEYLLSIVSFKGRSIRVFMKDGLARAEMNINGNPAFLERVFIQAAGAFSKPQFIEFYGKDIRTLEERVEKVSVD